MLADAMHYAQTRFKPQAMIDLATLTRRHDRGAWKEYAGVFSNSDGLSEQLPMPVASRLNRYGGCRWARPITSS